ncbi:MAG: hypothetical protein COB04_14785 [Gammaproteobacteria bacterium]|nr:MAG: hypothetical protein COB04_14785 [Gammaproteobacteria bacterium]
MAVINEANKQGVMLNRARHTPDLSGFIVRCEANYRLLLKLMPDIQDDDELDFGLAPLQQTFGYINISVTERCKYTTTITITQTNHAHSDLSPEDQDLESEAWLQESTMSIRLYHDARMAEVLSFQKQGRIKPSYEYPNRKMFQRDEKAQLNQFLGEWLNYCLRVGQVLDNPMDSITSNPST